MQFEHQVTNFAGDNLKHRVTLVPSGAGVVCHIHMLSFCAPSNLSTPGAAQFQLTVKSLNSSVLHTLSIFLSSLVIKPMSNLMPHHCSNSPVVHVGWPISLEQ